MPARWMAAARLGRGQESSYGLAERRDRLSRRSWQIGSCSGEGKDVALAVSQKGPYVAWVSKSGIQVLTPSEKRRPACLRRAVFLRW